ncbi:sensor histidine kinase [Streptomyces sp. NPDC051016]|uniref:sensor histidine kinase n=1 Tax=Streptomyces sp. NPDC051016 TaxID=3365638 RepID=UPI00378BD567
MTVMSRWLRVLRLLWPATLRNRLTLLVGAGTLALLAATAFAVAVQTRTSLLAAARQNIPSEAVFGDSVMSGTYVPGMGLNGRISAEGTAYTSSYGASGEKVHAEQLQPCTRSILTAEGAVSRRSTYCITAPFTVKPPYLSDLPDPEGSLSLLPWSDSSRAPAPLRRVRRIQPSKMSPKHDRALVRYLSLVRSLRPEQARLNAVVWQLGAGTLGLTLLVAGGTWLVAGRVLRSVEAIRADFAELSAHHLDRRVTVPRAGRELSRLADTMNTTLDRLQSSVDRQRQFTADASHELRTPLACLRTELELALHRPDTADWPRVVRDAHDDTLRLQALTTDLLLLARLDAGHAGPPNGPPLDLCDLVRVETGRRRLASHLTLAAHIDPGPIPVHGHQALLARVLGNLLDNAERHAITTITVRLTCDGEHRQAVLEIRDDGPGIPSEHHQRIFERFSRLDDARARDDGGAGLGLAIAERIATTHHGTLAIASSRQGAHFLLHLPTTTPPSQDP